MKQLVGRRWLLLLGVAALVVVGGALTLGVAWRYRHRLRPAYDMTRAVLDNGHVEGTADYHNVLFIHHSTGHNLIAQGNVRELFTAAGYAFWDHDYNPTGLTRPDGTPAGYSYNIPRDNTDPDGLAQLFAQRAYAWPVNALSGALQHDVIVFKSCFPVSDIASQEQLETYKRYYLGIRDVIDQHPDHLFIAMSPPPLVPESTTPENAVRAREFANWLTSDEYLSGHPNLYTFDFFDQLAEGDRASPDYSMLRTAYRPEVEGDSHPNQLANETVGPRFVEFIIASIEAYRAADNG
jgi:hypothetical protein